MLFAAVTILLVQALAAQASVFSHHPGDDIEAFCSRKSTELTSFSQLQKLDASSANSSCARRIKQAIADLVEIIKHGQTDLCSAGSIEKMHNFYVKYLVPTEGHIDLPKPLRRFALAYGMQMSNACKKNMLEILTKEGHQLLASKEFEPFAQLVHDESPIVKLLKAVSEPGEVYMPGDLAPLFKKETTPEKLYLQSATGTLIKDLQKVCEQRFKPLYAPLMTPLVRLANIGLSYKDAEAKCDAECPRNLRELGQWSAIVFVCEAIGNIRIVEDQADKEQAGDNGSKLVRILTKEEVAQIEGAEVDAGSEDGQETTQLAYQPKLVTFVDDLIYDLSNKRLVKAVKSVKTDMDEGEIIKNRLQSKGLSIVKSELKRGHFGVVISAAWKGLLRKKDQSTNEGVQIVKGLNDMIERQEANLDGSVSSAPPARGDEMSIGLQLSIIACFAIIVIALAGGIIGLTMAVGSG